MASMLIVGGSRGLGASLAQRYAGADGAHVFATTPTSSAPANTQHVSYIPAVDVASPACCVAVRTYLATRKTATLALVVVTPADYAAAETVETASFAAQERMFRGAAIGPTLLVAGLAADPPPGAAGGEGGFVSSEAGSVALRHESSRGGDYGWHASRAALHMSARLLALDLRARGIAVACVHPGRVQRDVARRPGAVDEGAHGAVPAAEAADSLADWIETLDLSKTGQFWAPRGPADIATVEQVLGPRGRLPTPLQLPW